MGTARSRRSKGVRVLLRRRVGVGLGFVMMRRPVWEAHAACPSGRLPPPLGAEALACICMCARRGCVTNKTKWMGVVCDCLCV